MRISVFLIFILFTSNEVLAQSWTDVGGGTNNSSHGMLVWDNKLVNLGSFNNPCNRVATWDGTTWECLDGGVGIVARAGCVWDGKLVVVGDFWNNFQPCPGCNGVAVWDGVAWSALDQGFNNDVLTCAVHDGELYIGGDFTQANGVPINRVAKWDTQSNTFVSVGNVTSLDNDVRCMASYDGQLWVGGDFNNVDGCSPCDGLVKWDDVNQIWEGGNSGVDLVGGVNETVRVLFVNPADGDLYMGGHFPELWDGDAPAQNFDMSYVARYDGSNWFSLGTGLNEYCRAIHDYNGDVIIGGYFTDAGGTPAQKIVKWNPITETFTAMGGGFDGGGVDEYVKSAMTWNGIFFAGGAYTQAEGNPMNYIAQWYEAPTNPPVAAMTASSNGGCEGTCIDFTDNSTNNPISWTWTFPGSSTPSSSSQNPSNICFPSSGSFTVQLEACNGNGCDITTQVITISETPTLTVNDETICDGSTANLTAVPSTTGGSYSWSPGSETTQSITVTPSTTTTYTVEYSLNGCLSNQATATVTVNPVPSVNVNDATICDGDNTVLTAVPSAGGGTFNWTPTGETTSDITVSPTSTTSYSVTYTLNGCVSLAALGTVNVNPTFNVAENVNACPGDLYTFPDGSTQTISANTSYTSALNTTNGCDSLVTTNVNMNQEYFQTENVNACDGSTYIYPDGFSEIITTNASHTSSFSSVNGCDSSITTNVTVVQQYSETESFTICQGDNFTYPDGAVSNSIQSSESHVSNLISSDGCDSIVTTDLMVTALPNTDVTVNGTELTADLSGATYQWLDCDNGMSPILSETNQIYNVSMNGSYAVIITDNGCVDTSDCRSIEGIGWDDFEIIEMKIYPNPTDGKLSIKVITNSSYINLRITDIMGRAILLKDNIVSSNTSGIYLIDVDLGEFADGSYYVEINNGEVQIIKRIVLQH